MQRYWRLKNNWILLVVSITLHAEACLFTNNKFGLFFSLTPIYIKKVKVKYQYFQEIMTIKKYSNPRAFWGICCHACSKVTNCACFFHLYLSVSIIQKIIARCVSIRSRDIDECSISVMTKAIVSFFTKEN